MPFRSFLLFATLNNFWASVCISSVHSPNIKELKLKESVSKRSDVVKRCVLRSFGVHVFSLHYDDLMWLCLLSLKWKELEERLGAASVGAAYHHHHHHPRLGFNQGFSNDEAEKCSWPMRSCRFSLQAHHCVTWLCHFLVGCGHVQRARGVDRSRRTVILGGENRGAQFPGGWKGEGCVCTCIAVGEKTEERIEYRLTQYYYGWKNNMISSVSVQKATIHLFDIYQGCNSTFKQNITKVLFN